MKIEYCGICDKGACREVNQDAIFMDSKEDMALFAVADGMGGHRYGEAASGIIVSEIQRWWERCRTDARTKECSGYFLEVVSSLRAGIERANRIIYEQYNVGADVCGSTVAVLLICGRRYSILSSGDSRVYCLKGFGWKQMTVDDRWENQPDIIARYRPQQLKQHAYYGRLIRAVGVSETVMLNETMDTVRCGIRFLICSDGLYKMCPEKELKKILGRYKGGQNGDKLLAEMIRKVYRNGARDNASAILVRCTDLDNNEKGDN